MFGLWYESAVAASPCLSYAYVAIQSSLHQRRVLVRCRCSEALGRHTRRQTMMPSSDAALAKSSAACRGEVRCRCQTGPSPCSRRLQWPHGRSQRPHRPCQLIWSRAAGCRCLGTSAWTLPAARRRRGAGSTAVRWLKEHRTFDCGQLFSSGLHGGMRRIARHAPVKERTDAVASCASAVFLGVSRRKLTLTLKPFKAWIQVLQYL